jgi:competence protein ComEA
MPLRLSKDESRAVAFIGLLLALGAGARLLDRPAPLTVEGPGVDLAELEAASRRKLAAETRTAVRSPPATPSPSRDAGSTQGRPPRAQPASPTREAPPPVELNRASVEELQRLPGIGAVLAQRIVAWRDSAGGFRSLADLERVRGIGPALMRRLTPLVRLGS